MKPLVPVALVVVTLCGCGGTSRPAAAPTPTARPVATGPSCPAVVRPRFAWPASYPQDLPQPPAATLTAVTKTPSGLVITKFRTEGSLRQGVVFVVQSLQKAGFVLGRGDAEPTEADAPFVRGDQRGVMKLLAVGPCTTDWLVGVSRVTGGPTGTSPLLPTPSHGGTASPLPFG